MTHLVALTLLLAGELAVPEGEPTPILNADVAGTCDWPSAVLMSGCSGTLVHPEIVIFAAHCGNTGTVRFGTTGGDRSAPTQYCRDAPRYPEEGWDIAYCKLSSPVTDVPIAPVMMGCEWDQLQVGTEVWMASFGQTSNAGGGFGTKRYVSAEVAGFPSDGKKIGFFYEDMNTGICSGDSGGANFVKLADGSWRAFGITVTTAGSCGGTSQSTLMKTGVPWIEEDSGIDITPCHDADGAWNPGPDCGAFPTDIEDGGGKSWADGCGPSALAAPSANCGPGFGEEPDANAPTITIDTPLDGTYDGPTYRTPIELSVSDDWGILDVSVQIDGMDIALLEAEPFKVGNVDLPEGTFEITATARDWSGNVTDAVPVVVVIGEGGADSESGDPSGTTGDTGPGDSDSGGESDSGPDGSGSDGSGPDGSGSDGSGPDDGGSDSDSGDGDSTATESDTVDADGDGATDGCACRATPSGLPWSSLAIVAGLVFRRRRGAGR